MQNICQTPCYISIQTTICWADSKLKALWHIGWARMYQIAGSPESVGRHCQCHCVNRWQAYPLEQQAYDASLHTELSLGQVSPPHWPKGAIQSSFSIFLKVAAPVQAASKSFHPSKLPHTYLQALPVTLMGAFAKASWACFRNLYNCGLQLVFNPDTIQSFKTTLAIM